VVTVRKGVLIKRGGVSRVGVVRGSSERRQTHVRGARSEWACPFQVLKEKWKGDFSFRISKRYAGAGS